MNWLKVSLQSSWLKFIAPLVLVISLGVFYAPLAKGLVPIPADALVGLYHPYRDHFAVEFPNGIPFKNFLITDPIRQQFVWKKLAIEELKQGHIPWWNPYVLSGTPLLATMQAGVFYPLNLIFWLADFTSAWTIFIMSQSILGATFFYWFMRSHKIHPLSASFGALSFIFSGFFTVWLEWGNIGHIVLWLPLLLLSIDKIITKGTWRWHAIFLIALISQFFAGHLQISFYVLLFTISYLAYRLIHIQSTRRRKLLPLFLAHFSWFIIITAIQWVPTGEFILLSARDVDQTNSLTRPDWFLPWQHLAQVVAPDFFGNPATLNYWGIWNYAEFVSYVGLIPFLLALMAVVKQTHPLSRFFALSLLLGLVFALPTPVAKLPFILNLPFISQAQPSRIVVLVAFSLSVLASIGFDTFLKTGHKKRLWLAVGIVFISIGSLWVTTFMLEEEQRHISQRNLILPSTLWIATVLLLGLIELKRNLLVTHKKISMNIGIVGIIALTSFDLLRFATKFTPFSPPTYLYPETKTIAFLKNDPDTFRFMSLDRRLLPPNVSLAYNLQTIEGYDPLYLKSYAALITELETGSKTPPLSFNRIITPTNTKSPLINELNVKYILSLENIDSPMLELVHQEGETRLYRNPSALPRARIISGTGEVAITKYSPNEVSLVVQAQTEVSIELADMMYPGWWAKVDGQIQEIETSPRGFRTLTLTPGEHQVLFFYSRFPPS